MRIIPVRLGIIRAGPDGALEAGDGVIQAALFVTEDAEVIGGLGKTGVERQRAPKRFRRVVPIAQFLLGDAQAVDGEDEVGVDGQRPLETGGGVFGVVLVLIDGGEGVMGFGHIRVEGEGALDGIQGGIEFPLGMQNDAQVEMRLGEIPVGGDGGEVRGLRLGQVAFLVQRHAVFERARGLGDGVAGFRLLRQLTPEPAFLAGRRINHGLKLPLHDKSLPTIDLGGAVKSEPMRSVPGDDPHGVAYQQSR